MSAEADLARAQQDAARARSRLLGTVTEIKRRLQPRSVAHEAIAGAREKGTRMAVVAAEQARQRPGLVAGAAAALAGLLLAKPLWRLVRRRKTAEATPDQQE